MDRVCPVWNFAESHSFYRRLTPIFFLPALFLATAHESLQLISQRVDESKEQKCQHRNSQKVYQPRTASGSAPAAEDRREREGEEWPNFGSRISLRAVSSSQMKTASWFVAGNVMTFVLPFPIAPLGSSGTRVYVLGTLKSNHFRTSSYSPSPCM
jgi:hypothetical protein